MSVKPDVGTLKEIFHSARELPEFKRKEFLDQACGADQRLRGEIEQLLESDRKADSFIAQPPAQLAAELFGDTRSGLDCGRIIGQYRLIECVGSGGMGAVYLAERADRHFEMQVAVKLIKRGMDTDQVLRRFQHERQILASLEHPNIARLLDGGSTEDGVSYFVMEYIKGEQIDRYAAQRQLSVTERLELFREVCGAVSYAHQHLVVHRDLKPSNILVTPDGTPKLLDFGIAKIIQPDERGEALATMTLIGAMTPEYASPEQIDGAAATTLSDVYSLGAVLYQLLSARPPYQLSSRSPQAFAKAIETAQIEKPSAVVKRAEDARRLRGDLDNIVLMAMRKDTARRYRSVEQFSDDIRRHLQERPVIARRDSLSYRAGKFLQRNRIGVAAAALLLLSLVGGVVATVWQAHKARLHAQRARFEQARAERRFNEVRKLANNILFDYNDSIGSLPGATKVQERLVKDALNYLDGLAAEAQGDPELQREVAAAYDRVGDVRGSLGDMAGAIESSTKAFTILEALVVLKPNDTRARRNLAVIHAKLGDRLVDTSQASKSLEHFQTARALYFDLAKEEPANDEVQRELASMCTRLASALKNRGDVLAALEQYRAALAICERLAATHPQDQKCRRALWIAQSGIASALMEQGNTADAVAANDKALGLGEALVAEDPLNVEYRRALAGNYKNGGEFRRSDYRTALEYLRKALPLEEQLVAQDPANAVIRKSLGFTHERIADFLANIKEDDAQALFHFSKAREIFEKLASDAPGDIPSRFRIATCGAGAAGMQARLGQVDPALEECRKAAAILREIAEDPANATHRSIRADAYQNIAYAYEALAALSQASASEKKERMTAAREMHQQGLNVLEDLRSRGALDPRQQKWASEIADEIAKCNATLANWESG